ncbi:MAG: methyl-accepting chemotaxis protein [Sphingopyxis sp.]
MKFEAISADQPIIDARLAAACGELAVGCSDVGGQVAQVAVELSEQVDSLASLEYVTGELEADQAQVAQATQSAKLLSAKATENINASARQVTAAIAEFGQLTNLVERLGTHVTNFASAMEQVRAVSSSIETIAKTTNMLALNAAIEAERAGDAGRTFAVVAGEVKKLASHTRAATEEIRRTVGSLSQEAEGLVREISAGVEESHRAELGFEEIAAALSRAIDLVALVDGQSDQISRSATQIHGNSQQLRVALRDYGVRVRSNADMLMVARKEVTGLEAMSNHVFHALVASGASTDDRAFVEYAMGLRDRIVALTQAALACGDISEDQLFDQDYRAIHGSRPQRFDTQLCAWAMQQWRPLLDEAAASDPRVLASVCSDTKGFLPTHISAFCKQATGDLQHDTQYCRNGRIIWSESDRAAKVSNEPFFMAVYRHEADGEHYQVTRNVYVPLHFAGRRWGDFEIAYRL